jgi:hypothetical protein
VERNPFKGESMTLVEAQTRVEELVGGGAPFEVVEEFVDAEGLTELQKAALWLLAWSCQDPRTQRRVAKEALALAAA